MRWYQKVLDEIKEVLPLRATQRVNLALLVGALLERRSCILTELARSFPRPYRRRVKTPKHDLLYRVKRLWRFLNNPRVDPGACQLALIPWVLARLNSPRQLVLSMDWTYFDVVAPPGGRRVRYQMLQIGLLWKKRAIPLLQVAYDRDRLPWSQNKLEEIWLARVLDALPPGTRVILVADRGFSRASFLQWLQQRNVDFVIRLPRGMILTDSAGRRRKLGQEGLRLGQSRWWPHVRYGLDRRGRPRELILNVLGVWQKARSGKIPEEPWYLATSLNRPRQAFQLYARRGWIEQTFRDKKSGIFGLHRVRIGSPFRLNRLLLALTLALIWLILLLWQHRHWMQPEWRAQLEAWGPLSLPRLALELLELTALSMPP